MCRPSHPAQTQSFRWDVIIPGLARGLRRTVTFPQPWGSPFCRTWCQGDLAAEVWAYPRRSTHLVVARARKMTPPLMPEAKSSSEGQVMAPPHGATKDREVLRGKSVPTKQPEDMCGYMEKHLVANNNHVQETQPARTQGGALNRPLLPHAGWTYRATSSLRGGGAPALPPVSRGVSLLLL